MELINNLINKTCRNKTIVKNINIMINFKRILITTFLCIFIFTLNISEAKSYNLNNSEIKTNQISKFIPEDNELLFYSNYKKNEINRFIKKKFTNDEIKKINILKKGLISFFNLNLEDNINDIYDNEFVLSTFKKPNKKRETLIIIKVKKENDLNKILDIDDNDYSPNKLYEIGRPNSLNFITHIIQTDDNYIICASNKELIFNSLKAMNNNKIRKFRENTFKSYKSRLSNKKIFLYTSNKFYTLMNIKPFNYEDQNFITKFNFDNNQLILNSFTLNNYDQSFDNRDLNLVEKNNIFISSNNISIYQDLLNNSLKNEFHAGLFEDIKRIIKYKLFIEINTNNWVIGFKKLGNKFSINKLTTLKNFHQDKFKFNDYTYTIFSKNDLENKDEEIKYHLEQPIFICESNDLIFLSNDLSELTNSFNNIILDNTINLESGNLIVDDKIIVRDFNNQIYDEIINIFKSLNYLTTEGVSLSIDSFEFKKTQKIPEIIPSIQFKTYINFL